jgi:hypothetical protein
LLLIVYVKEFAFGLLKEMPSKSTNPILLLSVMLSAPCSQVKGPGKGKALNDVEPPGQAVALTGAAPATAMVPAVNKSAAPILKGLIMALEIVD